MSHDMAHTFKAAPSPADTSGAFTINTGACGMKYEGPWFMPQLNTTSLARPEERGAVRCGAHAEGRRFRPAASRLGRGRLRLQDRQVGSGLGISPSYLVSDEGNKLYCTTTGRMPSNLALAQSWWIPFTKTEYGVENGQAWLDAFKEGQIDVVSAGVPRSKMWAETVKPVAWDMLNNGTAKAAEVLPKVDAKLQPMLDE